MTGKPDPMKDALKRELDRLAISSQPDPALLDAFKSLAQMQTGPQTKPAAGRSREALSSRSRGSGDDEHNAN